MVLFASTDLIELEFRDRMRRTFNADLGVESSLNGSSAHFFSPPGIAVVFDDMFKFANWQSWSKTNKSDRKTERKIEDTSLIP